MSIPTNLYNIMFKYSISITSNPLFEKLCIEYILGAGAGAYSLHEIMKHLQVSISS